MDLLSIGIAIILTIVSIIIGYHFGRKSQSAVTSTMKVQIKKLSRDIGYQINKIEERDKVHTSSDNLNPVSKKVHTW